MEDIELAVRLSLVDDTELAGHRRLWPEVPEADWAYEIARSIGFYGLTFGLAPGERKLCSYEDDRVLVVLEGTIDFLVDDDHRFRGERGDAATFPGYVSFTAAEVADAPAAYLNASREGRYRPLGSRSEPLEESVYSEPARYEPERVPSTQWDLVGDAERLRERRGQEWDSPELADEYVRLALRLGVWGHREQMIRALHIALDVRRNAFGRDDAMVALTYELLYARSAGVIPSDLSFRYLERAREIWDTLAARRRLPPFMTEDRLARLRSLTDPMG